jgi:gamma-tubulin complex component 2
LRDESPPVTRNKVTVNQTLHNKHGKAPERDVHIRVEVGEGEDEVDAVETLLDGEPLEIQEAWICEDLLFALQVGCVKISLTSRG